VESADSAIRRRKGGLAEILRRSFRGAKEPKFLGKEGAKRGEITEKKTQKKGIYGEVEKRKKSVNWRRKATGG